MFNIKKEIIEWCGKTLSIETGKVAKQADGSVVVSYGGTVVLCTATAAKEAKDGVEFFPLTVNYREMYFASGKIPGGFFKREGKPVEREVLTSRLIDRPIRPLFPEGFYNEVQVICTVLSYDGANDPDIVAMIGASAALALSGIPFKEAIAGIRVGMKNGELIFNPQANEMEGMDLDLVLAGTADSILMVESEAKELSEEKMLSALAEGHQKLQPVIKMINNLVEKAGKDKWEFTPAVTNKDLSNEIEKLIRKDLEQAYEITSKQDRNEKINLIKEKLENAYSTNEEIDQSTLKKVFKSIQQDIVRSKIINSQPRIDGRDSKTIRPIDTQIEVLPRTHGSALFTRGETQAIVVTTLGGTDDEQIVDTIIGDHRERFLLHYNFPPYSVGETSMLRPPGRREIGHGKLALRAIKAVLPSVTDFPYTIRTVSEITESNGSSSMATVCGASLSLMDAGVPINAPVAGIAMGLVKEGEKFTVLSDILGDEDHLGDMDFKVAGTSKGITALQMDIKISGINHEIMKIALEQAKEGRIHILGEMAKTISIPHDKVSEFAPVISQIQLNPEKIGEVIGPGGKMIRHISEKTAVTIDIDDNGVAFINAPNGEAAEKAKQMIKDIIEDPEIGKVYKGTVNKILDFGALVNYMGSRVGLVHISEIHNEKVIDVNDHLKEGDYVHVKLLHLDDRGKARLSIRLVDQETGEPLEDTRPKREMKNDNSDRKYQDKGHYKDSNKKSFSRNDKTHKPFKKKEEYEKGKDLGSKEDKPKKSESKNPLRKLFRL